MNRLFAVESSFTSEITRDSNHLPISSRALKTHMVTSMASQRFTSDVKFKNCISSSLLRTTPKLCVRLFSVFFAYCPRLKRVESFTKWIRSWQMSSGRSLSNRTSSLPSPFQKQWGCLEIPE